MNEIQDRFGNEKMPSVINDPFSKKCITRIYVSTSLLNGEWYSRGAVEFENGKTKGEQSFSGKNFDDIVLQIKLLINEM